MAQHTKNRKRTPDEIREQFQRMCDTQDASYICEAISEVAAQLCEQNAIAEKVAIEAKRINDHILNRDSIIEVKVRGGDAMLEALKEFEIAAEEADCNEGMVAGENIAEISYEMPAKTFLDVLKKVRAAIALAEGKDSSHDPS